MLSLEAKVVIAEQRIKQWYDYWDGQVYISFSGGKDSTVLLHIARKLYPNIKAVFVDTGLEYPEIRDFVKTWSNVDWIKPKKLFTEVIQTYGYPVISKEVSQVIYSARENIKRGCLNTWSVNKITGTALDKQGNPSMYNCSKYKYLLDAPFLISDKCCYHMKKSPVHKYSKDTGLKAITGQLAEESALRKSQWIKAGCNAYNATNPISNPLSVWTEQDVLKYIYDNELPIAAIYGVVENSDKGFYTTGVKRTGCMFCMYGVHLEKHPNRFEQMQTSHPKQYAYCMNKLHLSEVLDYIGVLH